MIPPGPLALVIFDCDGVLVDSEPVANRLVAEELTLLGWAMTPTEAEHHFLGKTFADMLPIIEGALGRGVPADWPDKLRDRLMVAMAEEVMPIPGAIEALHAVTALGLPWRIASNSSRAEMAVKFHAIGITALTEGRIHSAYDVARGKPAPDLFLATAQQAGIKAEACIVIEDSVPGALGARAAGMRCLGYAPHGTGKMLAAVGAMPFSSMYDLPGLLAQARSVA